MRRALIAALAAAMLGACSPGNPTAGDPEIRLYTLDCGRLETRDADAFADDGSLKGAARTLVDPCFLIRHPKGDLIWDTGFADAVADRPGGVDIPNFGHVSRARKLVAELQDLGLTPADIEFLSFSHKHDDHTGNGNLFAAHATWIVDKQERDAMFSSAARDDAQSFSGYSALENANTIVIEGDDPYDVFGDGSVTIHQAPGHTPGHTVLLVKLVHAGDVLLSGDMWHFAESQERRLVPRFNFNREMTLASMDKVEQLAADTHARLVRQHVPEDIAALPAFPQPLQ